MLIYSVAYFFNTETNDVHPKLIVRVFHANWYSLEALRCRVQLIYVVKAYTQFFMSQINITLEASCSIGTAWQERYIPLVERKDVSFILTIFPKNFWNKLYLIWKPLYRAFRISKKIGPGIILRVATPP